MPDQTQLAVLPAVSECMSEEMVRSGLVARVEAYNRGLDSVIAAVETLRNVGKNMAQAFPGSHVDFEVGVYFNGTNHFWKYDDKVEKDLEKHYNRQAWSAAVNEIQVWNVMGVEDSRKLRKQLDEGDLPEFTVDNVMSTIMGLSSRAKNFCENAAKEVFDFLTPSNSGLKTNSSFRVGKRAIIPYGVELKYGGGFRVSYSKDSRVRAMDAVFHMLDGKGPMKDGQGPLTKAIDEGTGSGETEYFKFRCFKNRNLHVEFKRLDLVKEINFAAAGERVLGKDTE